MLSVISPAKSLDMTARDVTITQPQFAEDAFRLSRTARNLSQKDLMALMGISRDLAKLNSDRFKAFSEQPSPEYLRPAMHIFAGDTYTGLDAGSLDADEVAYAQDHLRILSGLYGLLRPLDAIQPYRLEMGSKLKTRRGANLYAYWGDRLARALTAQAEATNSAFLVNCASQEYFGAIDQKALGVKVITPVFLEDKPGGAKTVSFFAKRARGAMARFIIENRLREPDALKAFDLGGYSYQPDRSTPQAPVFLRPDQVALRKAS